MKMRMVRLWVGGAGNMSLIDRYTTIMESVAPEKVQDVTALIHTRCQPYLRESGGELLWRGVTNDIDSPTIITVRTDRTPRDSTAELHHAMEASIRDAGKMATRSNSVFTTGDEDLAMNWGELVAVFPIGEFHYTWSPSISDATIEFSETGTMAHLHMRVVSAMVSPTTPNDQPLDSAAVKYVLDHTEFRRMLDEYATKLATEVDRKQIRGPLDSLALRYLLRYLEGSKLRWSTEHLPPQELITLGDQVFAAAHELLDKSGIWAGDDGTLSDAIDSGNEIMIHCKEVLLVPERMALRLNLSTGAK